MNRQALLVALLFATAAAGLVLAAYEGERRHEAYVAENPAPLEAEAPTETWSWSELLERLRSPDEPLIDSLGYAHVLAIVSICAYLWLLMLAFDEHLAWGIAVLFGSGIAVLIFVFVHPQKTLKTAAVMYVSAALSVWTLLQPG